MNRFKKMFTLFSLLTLILTGCFNSIDYKELLVEELNYIYSLNKAKHLYAIKLETNLNNDYESNNPYLDAWLDYLPDDSIMIDSAITVYKNSSEIRLFGEFAFMGNPQSKTYEIIDSYGLDFDFYVKKDDGVYFRSWAMKKMHDYFNINAVNDYADSFVKIYDSETANEIIDLINNYKSISEKNNIWSDLLLNEEDLIEDESAKFVYDVATTKLLEHLELNDSNLSNIIKVFLDITDWEARYVLIKEKLDNSTFVIDLNDSVGFENKLLETFHFETSRYVYSYDEPIDPR